MNDFIKTDNRDEPDFEESFRPSRSSSISEKFKRSLTIPLGYNSASAGNNTPSPTTPTTPSQASPTIIAGSISSLKSRSFLSRRSNSVPGIVATPNNSQLTLGKRIKRRLSSKKTSQQLTPCSVLTRTRSNSFKQKGVDSSSNSSPIFNTNSFVDITDNYFKYDLKKRNESNASSNDSFLVSFRGSSLDVSSQNLECESVNSIQSFTHDLTLSQIIEKNDITIENIEDEDEEEIAESMAFDILQKIKEMSLKAENEDVYSV